MTRTVVTVLWYALTAVLAVSTFWSSDLGVYGSVWFAGLWVAVAACLMAAMCLSRQIHHNIGSMMLHGALLLILCGGAVTWLSSYQGRLMMSPEISFDRMIADDGSVRKLPCTIRLDSFVIEKHRGLESPADYRSYVCIDSSRQEVISVNRPLDIDGFRFYQTSYDRQGGSLITVRHDHRGTLISYSGYLLLMIGWITVMINRKGRFRKLLRGTMVVIMATCAGSQAMAIDGIAEAEAMAMSCKQVLYGGRVTPFNTPATELVRKVTGKANFGGKSAEQVLVSLIMYPEAWNHVPMIYVKSKHLRQELNMEGSYISLDSLFAADGSYRLATMYEGGDKSMDRAILEVDEKVELLYKAQSGSLFQPLPDDMRPLPQWRIDAEIVYNTVPWTKIFFMVMLAVGLLSLVSSACIGHIHSRIYKLLMIVAIGAVLWQTCGYMLRWMIADRIPLGTGGETLQFISIVLGVIGIACGLRGQPTIGSLTLVMSGFAGLVAWLALRDPAITPLQPVLSSPWLAVHVSLIMTAYALLTLTAIIASIGIFSPDQRYRNMILLVLYPALFLLSAGIFSGAIWANESWGRYWAWDPKETWALITLMVYVVPLHSRISITNNRHRIFFAYILISFLTVIMTYYGVNFLPSLHAYQ